MASRFIPATAAASVRICRRQLRNLVGSAIALQPGHRAEDVATILARQACQALGARQAVASVIGADDRAGAPFRAVAGDARILDGERLRLLERAERGQVAEFEPLADPATRAVVAVASSVHDREGRPVLALMVADGFAGPFGEDDIAVLVGLAHIASLTLDNVRQRESAQATEDQRFALIDLLTVILGHAALLNTSLPESDDRRDDIRAIVAAAGQASCLLSAPVQSKCGKFVAPFGEHFTCAPG